MRRGTSDVLRSRTIDILLLISRWLHLVSAFVAVGGAAFMCFALLPAAKATLPDDVHERLREAVRARWVKFVHGAVALLLITGSINFVLLALPPKVQAVPYHPIFGGKVLAAFGVFFLAVALLSRGPRFAGILANRPKWLGVLLTLAGFVVLLSGVLNQVRSAQAPAASVGEG